MTSTPIVVGDAIYGLNSYEPTRRHTARIDAIVGNAHAVGGRGRKKAAKAVVRRKRTMSEEQRRAVAERMRKYWASRREAKQPVEEVCSLSPAVQAAWR